MPLQLWDSFREDLLKKRMFSLENYPPIALIRATWSSFLDVENNVLHVWQKNTDDDNDNDGFNDNYDDINLKNYQQTY